MTVTVIILAVRTSAPGQASKNRGEQIAETRQLESYLTLRPIVLIPLVAMAAPVFAQTATFTPEGEINNAFSTLNQQADFMITLSGNDYVGDTVTPFDVTLVWHQLGTGDTRSVKLSMLKRIAGQPVFEIRAQGDRLLKYDYRNRTYTSTTYHRPANLAHPEVRAQNYTSRMLGALVKETPAGGPESYIARLIQQAMGDAATGSITMTPVFYRRWMPSIEPFDLRDRLDLAAPGADNFYDPLLNPTYFKEVAPRTFHDEQDDDFTNVVYQDGTRKSLVFQISKPSVLQAIYYSEAGRTNNRERFLEWTMSFTGVPSNPQDSSYEYQFMPYTDLRGWRPLAGVQG